MTAALHRSVDRRRCPTPGCGGVLFLEPEFGGNVYGSTIVEIDGVKLRGDFVCLMCSRSPGPVPTLQERVAALRGMR